MRHGSRIIKNKKIEMLCPECNREVKTTIKTHIFLVPYDKEGSLWGKLENRRIACIISENMVHFITEIEHDSQNTEKHNLWVRLDDVSRPKDNQG